MRSYPTYLSYSLANWYKLLWARITSLQKAPDSFV